ncbi:MAG: molybdenum cofactor biosynthesis protein MoaE [Desulfobacterales bacterium]
MDASKMIADIKAQPDYHKIGMILCHNGVVRETAKDGRKVSGLRVFVDHDELARVIEQHKMKDGIIDIRVEIAEDRTLSVGENIMLLAVAGDVRQNVISVLTDVLNDIKTAVTRKEEFYRG